MAKVFDEENVHHFWGLSPRVDVLDLLQHLPVAISQHGVLERLAGADAIHILQIGASDCRNSAKALSSACTRLAGLNQVLHIWVYEEAPEVLARHMLLLSILLDTRMPVRQRTEFFLELHNNASIQATTAEYLEKQAKKLEDLTLDYSAHDAAEENDVLSQLFDLSLLKFQQRDDVAATFRNYSRKVVYDMQKAWDARSRKFYGTRYDYRRNAIDWDYHMRLAQQGTPGLDPSAGSIIHFYHFRRWRESGIAYELRDCKYNEVNRTLLSTAYGTRKEYKDRLGNDKGCSVSAWGYWGDTLNSPFHSFGTACHERSFFKISNKQFVHTSAAVAEYNVTAMIEEIRTGQPYALPKEGIAQSKLAAGPTTIEDLEDMAAHNASDTPSYGEHQDSVPGTDKKRQQWSAAATQTAEQQAQSASSDAAMLDRCKHVKIHFVTGDIHKLLLGRSKYGSMFSAITVGHRHVHLLEKQHALLGLAAPGALLAVETVKYMLQLSSKQVELFSEAVTTKALEAGWQSLSEQQLSAPDAYQLLVSPT
ncbi:Dynein assembly factor 3, axonemal, variant 2 [Trebouxia sp. C0010 RCD-2024]